MKNMILFVVVRVTKSAHWRVTSICEVQVHGSIDECHPQQSYLYEIDNQQTNIIYISHSREREGWMDALHDQLTFASSAYSCISLSSPERSASLSTVLPSLPVREAPLSLLTTLVDDDDAVLSRAVPVLPSESLSVLFGLNLMMNSLPVHICEVWVI